MGLDMYLTKKTYVKRWKHQPDDEKFEVTVTRGGKPYDAINPERVTSIVEDVGYWRKANHIHKWFVDNVQDGEDDCHEYYVDKDKLEKLLSFCKEVKDNPMRASDILPTQSGFFFGGTEYNEYYFEDINNTIKILERALNGSNEDCFYYYQSSW